MRADDHHGVILGFREISGPSPSNLLLHLALVEFACACLESLCLADDCVYDGSILLVLNFLFLDSGPLEDCPEALVKLVRVVDLLLVVVAGMLDDIAGASD